METWEDIRRLAPEAVQRVLLPWEWDRERLWALGEPVDQFPLSRLRHLLDLPMSRSESGVPFTVEPAAVLLSPESHGSHFRRVLRSDLGYPVDVTSP